jgi:hypothetical protein
MTDGPTREFGKRRQAALEPSAPPAKRSSHVALLLMGTFAVGGGAFALMPRGTCEPGQPGMTAPAGPQPGCTSSRWSGGGHGYWGGSSRYSFFGGDSSSSRPSSGAPAESGSGVTRGGFGSFAQSISAHFSRGG